MPIVSTPLAVLLVWEGALKIQSQCPDCTLKDSDLIDLGQVQALVYFKSSPELSGATGGQVIKVQ